MTPAPSLIVLFDGGCPICRREYLIRDGVPWAGETWNLPLYGPEPSPRPAPADKFELTRDSVFWKAGDSTRRAARPPGSYYRLRSFTAWEQGMLARYLLGRPDRSAALLPAGTARVEIIADTMIRTRSGSQRVRLVMIQGTRGEPSGAWLDDRGEVVAGEASGWFVTVRRGSEELIPTLRAAEFRFRAGSSRPFAPSAK